MYSTYNVKSIIFSDSIIKADLTKCEGYQLQWPETINNKSWHDDVKVST